MTKLVTLESLLVENDYERNNIDIFQCEDEICQIQLELTEESMNIDDLMNETNSYCDAIKVSEETGLTCESSNFKETVKNLFKKIIEFLKKALQFIIRIFEYPFLIIRYIFQSIKAGKDVFKWVNIAKSKKKIKTRASDFTEKFEKEVQKFKAQTKNDSEILDESFKELKFVEEEFISACKENNIDPEDLKSSMEKLKLDSLKRMERIEKEIQRKLQYDVNKLEKDELLQSNCEISEIAKNLLNTIQDYDNHKNDAKKVSVQSKKILSELSRLDTEVERIKTEGSLNAEYASTISKTLNVIRSSITGIARRGGDISKWFMTANRLMNAIENVGGALNHYVDETKQFDEINGIPVYVVDDASAAQWGGAACVPMSPRMLTMLEYVIDSSTFSRNSIDSVKNDKTLDSNQIYSEINDADKIDVIIISETISKWRDSHNNWYLYIIGHEIGHLMNKDNQRGKVDATRTGNNTSSKYNSHEAMADRVGVNISGVSDSERQLIAKELLSSAYKALDDLVGSPGVTREAISAAKLNLAVTIKTRFALQKI